MSRAKSVPVETTEDVAKSIWQSGFDAGVASEKAQYRLRCSMGSNGNGSVAGPVPLKKERKNPWLALTPEQKEARLSMLKAGREKFQANRAAKTAGEPATA